MASAAVLGQQIFTGKTNPGPVTTDYEPLTIDTDPIPPAPDGYHWEFDHASVLGWLSLSPIPSNSAIGTGSPIVSLCIVPNGTPPETLVDANSTVAGTSSLAAKLGFSIPKRGLLIPTSANTVGQGGAALPAPNGGYAFSMVSVANNFTIPNNYIIRGIVNCNPGDQAPGPGAGSFGTMLALLSLKKNE